MTGYVWLMFECEWVCVLMRWIVEFDCVIGLLMVFVCVLKVLNDGWLVWMTMMYLFVC